MQKSHPWYLFIHYSFIHSFIQSTLCQHCTRSWRLRVNKTGMAAPTPPRSLHFIEGFNHWLNTYTDSVYINNHDLCSEVKSFWALRPCEGVGSPVYRGRTEKDFPKIKSEEWAVAAGWPNQVGRRMLPTHGTACDEWGDGNWEAGRELV